MTYNKLTKNELENWSQQFDNFFSSITEWGVKNKTLNAKELTELTHLSSLISVQTKLGNTRAIVQNIEFIKAAAEETWGENWCDKTFKEIGGRVFKDWENEVKKRLKEHCIAGGYYDPSKPEDVVSFKERFKNIKKWWKDLDYRLKLLECADPENREFLSNLADYFAEKERIFGESDEDEKEEKENHDEKTKEWYFVLEDSLSRVEKAEKALEEKEKAERDKNNPPLPTNNPPSKNKQENNKLPKDNNEIKWIIGLGIVAVVIILFIVIFVRSKKKR